MLQKEMIFLLLNLKLCLMDETLCFVNFTMSMMDEGTEKYNALEFDEKESSLGAGIGFGSSLDTTYASLSSLKANISD